MGTIKSSNEEPVRVQFMCCTQLMPFDKMLDEEGFLICPLHEQRRYGWRSPYLKGEQRDFGISRLERDQAFVRDLFGELNDV